MPIPSSMTEIATAPALPTAVTGAVFTAVFTICSPEFIAFASVTMLISGVASFSLGDALTYRDAVTSSAVSRSGVARAAVDYHCGEYGS